MLAQDLHTIPTNVEDVEKHLRGWLPRCPFHLHPCFLSALLLCASLRSVEVRDLVYKCIPPRKRHLDVHHPLTKLVKLSVRDPLPQCAHAIKRHLYNHQVFYPLHPLCCFCTLGRRRVQEQKFGLLACYFGVPPCEIEFKLDSVGQNQGQRMKHLGSDTNLKQKFFGDKVCTKVFTDCGHHEPVPSFHATTKRLYMIRP